MLRASELIIYAILGMIYERPKTKAKF